MREIKCKSWAKTQTMPRCPLRPIWLVRQDMLCSVLMLKGQSIYPTECWMSCRRKVKGPPMPHTFLHLLHHLLWLWLWFWFWFRLYLWLCFYLGLRLRGYFYFYYLLLGYGHAACTKPPGRGRVSEKAVNEDHRHDRAIRNQKWEITLVTQRMDRWARDRAAGERETHDDERRSVNLSHRSHIELLRWKPVQRGASLCWFYANR